MKKQNNILICGCLLTVWTLVIWQFSFTPADESTLQSNFIIDLLNSLPVVFLPATEFIVRKGAHLTEFFMEGVFLCLFGRAIGKLYQGFGYFVLAGVVVAMVDETIQLYSPGRSSQVSDVWLDSAGALLGLLLVCGVFKYSDRKSIKS